MSVQRFLFPKQNRLTGKKNIETLLSKGEAFFVFPYRVVYITMATTEKASIQVLIAVPKRKCKLAVQRNRIKRITREAYRLQLHLLAAKIPANKQLHIMLQYISSDTVTQQAAMLAVKKILQKLTTTLESVV